MKNGIAFMLVCLAALLSPLCALCQESTVLEGSEKRIPVVIENAKISTETQAFVTAIAAYTKAGGRLSAQGSAKSPSIVILGFDVPDFAKRGEKVWEVRITDVGEDGGRNLKSIIWVHPQTGATHLVIGPWIAEEKK